MADPTFINIPEGGWTVVATDTTTGLLHKTSHAPSVYLQTYRLTGGTAPTLVTDGVEAFKNLSNTEVISSADAIDVYLWAVSADGRVRADI